MLAPASAASSTQATARSGAPLSLRTSTTATLTHRTIEAAHRALAIRNGSSPSGANKVSAYGGSGAGTTRFGTILMRDSASAAASHERRGSARYGSACSETRAAQSNARKSIGSETRLLPLGKAERIATVIPPSATHTAMAAATARRTLAALKAAVISFHRQPRLAA